MTDKEKTAAVTISLPNQSTVTTKAGRSLLEISEEVQESYGSPIAAAIVNGKMKDLTHQPPAGSAIRFLDLGTTEGARIYQRSLTFLLIYAAKLLFPTAQINIEHSLGKGLYCEIQKTPALSADDVAALEQKMRELVYADLPIEKKKYRCSRPLPVLPKPAFLIKCVSIKVADQ